MFIKQFANKVLIYVLLLQKNLISINLKCGNIVGCRSKTCKNKRWTKYSKIAVFLDLLKYKHSLLVGLSEPDLVLVGPSWMGGAIQHPFQLHNNPFLDHCNCSKPFQSLPLKVSNNIYVLHLNVPSRLMYCRVMLFVDLSEKYATFTFRAPFFRFLIIIPKRFII